MADIPYVLNYGKVDAYFAKIQGMGVPDSINQKWLESIGFKSKNDRYLIAFLKDLGFADSTGRPKIAGTTTVGSSGAGDGISRRGSPTPRPRDSW